jgi:hypothetical protein
MADDARFAYLQARLQARHGDRPSPDDWRVAESSTDLSHFLEAARRTSLRRWTGDINHEMEPEAIERLVRAGWRSTVDDAASWVPEQWRAAVEWLRWLPDLPALAHLLRGGPVAPWMRDDPVMREIAFDEPQRRRDALVELPLSPLQPEGDAPEPDLVRAWLAEWRRRLPAAGRASDDALGQLVSDVLEHLDAMRRSEEPHGRALRNGLAAQAARKFRRGAGSPLALFAYLVLEGLELERVRAGIMRRRLMPERVEGRSWA